MPELLGLGALVVLYGLNSFRYEFPVGYAGLYSQMTEEVLAQPWPMPREVPLYGPGGLPFAFPPLGAYLAAFAVGALEVPLLDYIRWAPAVLTILSLGMLYGFVRDLHASQASALLAVTFVAGSEQIYADHATAAGMVRGLGLLWVCAGLFAYLRAVREGKLVSPWTAAAAALFGLAVMTHLSYAVFLALAIVAIGTLDRSGSARSRLRVLAVVLAGGLAIASPWALTVTARFGPSIWTNVGQTHGTLGIWQRAAGSPVRLPMELVRSLLNLGRGWTPHFLPGLALFGLGYSVWRRQWAMPALLIFLSAVLGEATRFEILLGGLLAANLVVDVVPLRGLRDAARPNGPLALRLAAYSIVVGSVLYQGARAIYGYRPAIDSDLLRSADWIRERTSDESAFLLLPNDHDRSEWAPFLTGRTLSVAHWGAEWTGEYARQQALQDQLAACVDRDSWGCVTELAAHLETRPTYLIIDAQLQAVLADARADPAWQTRYESGRHVILEQIG
jgi:4-amino-4-deoxy-L-arabinose transferase-like glycosyltransferase